jgi:phosphoglucosamine mutase
MIAALQALAVMVETGKPLSELASVFKPVPQKLVNIRYSADETPLEDESVKSTIAGVEQRLGSSGRLVIRKSGTEPLIRVMAEAEDAGEMESAVSEVADAVRAAG